MDFQSAVEQAGPDGEAKCGEYSFSRTSGFLAFSFEGGGVINIPDKAILSNDWEVVPEPHGFQVGDTVEAQRLRFEIVYIDRLDCCALAIKCTTGSKCGSLGKNRHVSELKFISRPDKPEVHVFEKIHISKEIVRGEQRAVPWGRLDSQYLQDEDCEFMKLANNGEHYRLTLEKMDNDGSED